MPDIEFRWVKGRAEMGYDNAQLQYRTRDRGKWSAWRVIPIVTDDSELLK